VLAQDMVKPVPYLLGFPLDRAEEIAKEAGYFLELDKSVELISYHPVGTIADQRPAAGTGEFPRTTITVRISRGLFLPSLIGWDSGQALRLLQSLGIDGAEALASAGPDVEPLNQVLGHDPAPGEFFSAGDRIILHVSKGTGVSVPNLQGLSYDLAAPEPGFNIPTAVGVTKAAGLNIKRTGGYFETSWRPTLPPCEGELNYPIVGSQVPAAGTVVFKGTTVNVETKKGSWPTFSGPPPGQQCK
jgi:beta-lactam-binding protein with PASTA domain